MSFKITSNQLQLPIFYLLFPNKTNQYHADSSETTEDLLNGIPLVQVIFNFLHIVYKNHSD